MIFSRSTSPGIHSLSKFDRILESISEVVWHLDFQNPSESFIGHSAEKIFGRPCDELLKSEKFWHEGAHPLDHHVVKSALNELHKDGYTETIFRIIRPDGSSGWISCKVHQYTDNGGLYQQGVLSDVSTVKETEHGLVNAMRSLEEFRKAINESSIVSRANLHGIIIDVNENFEKISGFTKAELIGNNHRIINSGYHDKAFWTQMWRTVASGQIWRADVRNKAKDGSYYWVDTFIMPFRDEHGKITEFLSIRNDITSRKQVEENLKRSEENLRAIFNNTHDFFILTDEDFKIRTYSTTNSVHNLLADLKVGASIETYFPTSQADVLRADMQSVKRGETVHHDLSITVDGEERWIDVTMTPVLDDEGLFTGSCITSHETTHLKRIQTELEQQRIILEKAQETAKLGSYVINLQEVPPQLTLSTEAQNVLGIHNTSGSLDEFISTIHHEDRERFRKSVEHALAHSGTFRLDHRVSLPDGTFKWVYARGRVLRDKERNLYQMIGVVQDITERKLVEEILTEYNERFEMLSKATNDAIWDWDIIQNHVHWNHGLETLFGYREREVRLTTDWMQEKIHPEDLPGVLENIERCFKSKLANWTGTYRFRHASGEYRYIQDRSFILYQEGKPSRMIGAKQDITDRVVAQQEIEKLSLVASKTHNGVVITDPSRTIEWVNESFLKQFGIEFNDTIGRNADGFLSDTDVSGLFEHISIERLSNESLEILCPTAGGKRRWMKIHITPVTDQNHHIRNYIILFIDINDRKEYEARITAIARELASLIENANVPIFSIGDDELIREWNKVSENLTGFSRIEVVGLNWIDEFVFPHERDTIRGMITKVITDGISISNLEVSIQTRLEEEKKLLISVSPRRNDTRQITGVIIVGQNITELSNYRSNLERMVHERTRELNEALRNEKNVVELKSKFVSIASHEFRTPLSTITLLAGSIRKYHDRMTGENIEEKVDSILKQVNHMTYLLDDVLTIGKADAGKIPVKRIPIDIGAFVTGIINEVQQASSNTHQVIFHQAFLKNHFDTDEKLLRNIVINLLTNAIKFSPGASSIEVNVQCDSDMLIIDVIDNGIGIPEADLRNLYEPFFRASNVAAVQGTGLGLSIVKKAVDLLEGSIRLKSKVGLGTEVTVIIPRKHE